MSGTGQGHQRGKGAQVRSEEEPEPQSPEADRGSKVYTVETDRALTEVLL